MGPQQTWSYVEALVLRNNVYQTSGFQILRLFVREICVVEWYPTLIRLT